MKVSEAKTLLLNYARLVGEMPGSQNIPPTKGITREEASDLRLIASLGNLDKKRNAGKIENAFNYEYLSLIKRLVVIGRVDRIIDCHLDLNRDKLEELNQTLNQLSQEEAMLLILLLKKIMIEDNVEGGIVGHIISVNRYINPEGGEDDAIRQILPDPAKRYLLEELVLNGYTAEDLKFDSDRLPAHLPKFAGMSENTDILLQKNLYLCGGCGEDRLVKKYQETKRMIREQASKILGV